MSANADIAATVLAAGEGTRLRPLTLFRPKPLIPIHGRPILDHILTNLRSLECGSMALNAHYMHNQLEAWTRVNAPDVQISIEASLLGSGGGVRAMAHLLTPADHYLYHNGDILSDVSLRDLVAHHRATEAEVTMLVVRPDAADGNVGFSPSTGKITRLPANAGVVDWPAPDAELVSFGGIMLFRRSIIDRLPDTAAPCIIRDAIAPALRDGARVVGFRHEGRWSDLGTPARWLDGLRQLGPPPFADEPMDGLTESIVLSDGTDQVRFVPSGN